MINFYTGFRIHFIFKTLHGILQSIRRRNDHHSLVSYFIVLRFALFETANLRKKPVQGLIIHFLWVL